MGSERNRPNRSSSDTAPSLLTVAEAASRLRVSVWAIRRWIRQGRFPFVRLGRTIRIDPRDLERILREGGMPETPEIGREPDGEDLPDAESKRRDGGP